MTTLRRLAPQSLEGQMVAILTLALLTLLAALMVLELTQHESAIDTANGSFTLERIRRLYPVLASINEHEVPAFLEVASSCHAGHEVTDVPYMFDATTQRTEQLRLVLAHKLALAPGRVRVGHARLDRRDFAYRKCNPAEIDLPIEGIVIGLELPSGKWFNAEVHSHEWHIREKLDWMLRATVVFVLVGAIAMFFMRRTSRPLRQLTNAARSFGTGLKMSMLEEDGPADLRNAIRSFNAMQRQVTDEIARRTNTLAAISHDVRTPLTALRVKAELIEDVAVRADLVASINRMEQITAAALEFLRGESRGESLRRVDVSALAESECAEFEELGHGVQFIGESSVQVSCRPDALARAVRNLIDNAMKYAGHAEVAVRSGASFVDIVVADRGPGIPEEAKAKVLEPFVRLSAARESATGGFGLGLAVAKAICDGHDGELLLADNEPTGLRVTVRLPRT